jgi:putative lipoic acid-binding regulatory protein
VTTYPVQRTFTAIGRGDAAFRAAMVGAVEQVVGSVHIECVSERSSSRGRYVSVTVGPVWVRNSDEVRAARHSPGSRRLLGASAPPGPPPLPCSARPAPSTPHPPQVIAVYTLMKSAAVELKWVL